MPRLAGSRGRKNLAREAIAKGRASVKAGKGEIDTSLALDSLGVLEEIMRHFYFKARILEGLGEGIVDWDAVDRAMEQAGKWAKEVATFRHARIAAIKIAGDPNEQRIGEQTLDQLKVGIMADLAKLANVLNLEAIAAPQGIENFAPKTNGEDTEE